MKKFCALVLFFCFASFAAAGTWSTQSYSGIKWSNLAGHAAVALDSRSFLVAFGFNESIDATPNTFYNDVYKVDVKSKTVTKLTPTTATVPPARTFPQCYISNGLLKCFGGVTYVSTLFPQLIDNFEDMWQFDPNTRVWTQIFPSGTIPPARNSAATAFVDGKFWMFGGIGGDDNSFNYRDYNDLWYYDDAANEWVNVTGSMQTNTFIGGQPVFPSNRYGVGNAVCGQDSLWYLAGGEALGGPFAFITDVWSFDFATLTWKLLPAQNDLGSRRYRAAVCLGDVLFIHGNYYPDGVLTTFNVTNEDNIYDIDINTWCRYDNNDDGPYLNRNGLTKVGDHLYTSGGFSFTYFNATSGTVNWDNNIHSMKPRRHLRCGNCH